MQPVVRHGKPKQRMGIWLRPGRSVTGPVIGHAFA